MIVWKDYTQDLDKDIISRDDDYKLFNRNQNSNGIRVTLTRGNDPANISGLYCHGYVMCRNGVTYHAYGENVSGITGNSAWFIVPNDVYLVPGLVTVSIMLSSSVSDSSSASQFVTVLSARMIVERNVTGNQREPSSVAVQIENIAQMYTQMEQAKSGAEAAAAFVPNMISLAYDSARGYSRGEYMIKDNYLYVAMNDVAADAEFSAGNFAAVKVGEALMLNPKYIRYFFNWEITASSSITVFNGTYKFSGGRFTLNGSTENKASAYQNFDMMDSSGTVRYTNDTTIPSNHKGLILINGHRYRLRTRYISGTVSTIDTGVIPYARCEKVVFSARLASNYVGKTYTDRNTGDTCTDFVYDSTEMPNGIMVTLYTSRTGGPVWDNYTGEVTLEDITSSAFEYECIAPVETSPAIADHAVGDLFILNSCLYKAISAINSGEDIKTGGASANVTKTSIAEVLSNINS